MSLNFRFAIVSDLHIGLPHTIPDHPLRFHRIEISIANFSHVVDQLSQLDIDFLLIPGDLTQNGEPENHQWLTQALAKLPFPAYVIPGNHDAVERQATDQSIGIHDFPNYYRKHGYDTPEGSSPNEEARLYYSCTPLPGLRLIGLNSIFYGEDGKQHYTGRIDQAQLEWLRKTLTEVAPEDQIFVMVHHNVLEHLPNQTKSTLGRRYMLENTPELIEILQSAGVQFVFTGHLHVQDIAHDPQANLFDITTGSMVSYPHPYRMCRYWEDEQGKAQLKVESQRVTTAPGWPDLQQMSRDFMGEHSLRFIRRLLTEPPLNLSEAEADPLLPHLRDFWADIADGDAQFDFVHLPKSVQEFFEAFGAQEMWDNNAVLDISAKRIISRLHSP